MIKRFFSPSPIWQENGLTLIRIIVGIFMTYHGSEVFDLEKMTGYEKWMTDVHYPAPMLMAYLGKSAELVGGILLILGFLTRLALIPLTATMLVIIFGLGKGIIFMDDQYPFLFVLLFLMIFFAGPGKFSLDYLIFRKKGENS